MYVCVCVCLLVMFVSPAKTAESIEMPFRVLTWVVPTNHVLHRVEIPTRKGNLEGESFPYGNIVIVRCALTAESLVAQ